MSWYRLRWPRELSPNRWRRFFVCWRRLPAAGCHRGLVSPGIVEHRLALPASRAGSVVDQLRAAIPGLSVEETPNRPPLEATRSSCASRKRRPLRTDDWQRQPRHADGVGASARRASACASSGYLAGRWRRGRPESTGQLRPGVVDRFPAAGAVRSTAAGRCRATQRRARQAGRAGLAGRWTCGVKAKSPAVNGS